MSKHDAEMWTIAQQEAREAAEEQPWLHLAAEDMRRALEAIRKHVLRRHPPQTILNLIDAALDKTRGPQ